MFYIFPNLIPSLKCDQLLEGLLKEYTFEEGAVKTADSRLSNKIQQSPDSTYRQGSVAFLKPAHDYIHTTIDDCITKANNNYFNYNIRSLEAVQFTRYEVGDYYHWHQDWLNADDRQSRKLSLILNLSDYKDFDGGRLEFFSSTEKASGFTSVRFNGKDYNSEEVRDFAWSKGTVLVFCSRDWHRITPLTKGIRYSIVSWISGPNLV